ncbi:SDR family oxidoreductase (plasmid) [Tistrella bauzanensis]|jgi:citronellol/citronellal dehydrogenase|uniref:SDR family oxidoreductase n=1 Tax=Tistrella TaxID=171436 RepID=UPI0031F60DEC
MTDTASPSRHVAPGPLAGQHFAPGLLAGKTALVSGAGSGLGRAIAIAMARAGADLVICGRRPEPLEATATSLRELGARVLTHPMTIRDPDQVAGLFVAATGFGGIDILVNNAGGQFPQAAIDMSPKGWNAVIDTNLNGSWYMMQAAARAWRDAARPGSIVSITAPIWRGMPGVAHTCAARAGVVYLSKTLAVEWAPLAIRVNCIAAGVIDSEGMRAYTPEVQRAFDRSNPMMRKGRVDEVADACLFLAGPTAGYITGEVLNVDGGQQMWGELWTNGRPDYFAGD